MLIYDILKQSWRGGEYTLAALLETNPFKVILIRCCPIPFGVGFSFVIHLLHIDFRGLV